MYTSELEDKEVVAKDGTVVGRSTNAVIDPKAWRVTALEVDLDSDVAKELDVKKMFKGTNVPLAIEEIQAVGSKVLLRSDKQGIAPHIVKLASQQQ